MKHSAKLFAAAILLVTGFYLVQTGCQKTGESKPAANNNPAEPGMKAAGPARLFYHSGTKATYNMDDAAQLKTLVTLLAGENLPITIEDAAFTTLEDSKGSYPAINAHYKHGDFATRLVIPLALRDNSLYMIEEDGCEMKCTSAWGCSSCKQEIIQRCKEQKCTCESGTGGCSSKITFN